MITIIIIIIITIVIVRECRAVRRDAETGHATVASWEAELFAISSSIVFDAI